MTSVSTAINTRFDIYDNGWAAGCGGACPAAQNTGKDLVRTNAAPGGNNCALHNQGWRQVAAAGRSEEHTSELQSLMRNSYAVFCLKKKIKEITTSKYETKQSKQ